MACRTTKISGECSEGGEVGGGGELNTKIRQSQARNVWNNGRCPSQQDASGGEMLRQKFDKVLLERCENDGRPRQSEDQKKARTDGKIHQGLIREF